MSDEEKEAMDELWHFDCAYNGEIKIVLNLIEKQSKEIEELKEKNKNLNWYFENQKDNFVHKDKIKAKIEEVKDGTFDAKIVLQSLLEKE